MATIIKLRTYLQRQNELFNAYISSNGKEISVLPFIEKYQEEDEKEYTGDDLLKYISSFVHSKRISDEELASYNKTKKVPNDIIFKRGRIIIEEIIASHGDTKNLEELGQDFAKKDGRLHPYDNAYLLKCRDYYLKTSKNLDILLAYKNVCELVNRGSYDIELPIRILNIKDNKKAIQFINRINISKTSLRRLIDEYETLYPASTANITRLNFLLKEAYKTETKENHFYESNRPQETLKTRLTSLRRMLEEYLIKDIEDISNLFSKYHFNSYKFNETLKDANSSKDVMLHNLVYKYLAKVNAVNNTYKTILNKIMQAKYNGINYGYGYREFNAYDYYMLKEEIPKGVLIKYAKQIYDEEDASSIISVIEEYEVDNPVSREELMSAHKEANTELILDYLEYASIPLSEKTFASVLTRFAENDISFEVIEPQKVTSL